MSKKYPSSHYLEMKRTSKTGYEMRYSKPSEKFTPWTHCLNIYANSKKAKEV